MAELEVAALAARLGRHQDARPVVGAEPRDLGVAPRRRQILVEDAAGELRARAERVAQHLQRLAMRDEDERLLVRPPPALACVSSQSSRGSVAIHRLRLLPQLGLVGPEHGLQRRAGRERPPDTIQRAPPADRHRGAAARRSPGAPRASRSAAIGAAAPGVGCRARGVGGTSIADGRARRQAADVDAARRAGARRQRHAGREPRLDVHPLGKLLRPQQLQQPEEPVRIVFERRRAEQQHVASERGDRRDRAVARLAGMPGRTPQPLGFVDDEQVDARRHRLARSVPAARSASRARSPRGDGRRTG